MPKTIWKSYKVDGTDPTPKNITFSESTPINVFKASLSEFFNFEFNVDTNNSDYQLYVSNGEDAAALMIATSIQENTKEYPYFLKIKVSLCKNVKNYFTLFETF